MLLIDLLYELLVHSALFSVYFSMFVFALGLTAFVTIMPRLLSGHIVVRVRQDYRLTQRRFVLPQMIRHVFIVWFVRVFKGTNVANDSDEDSSSLSFHVSVGLRGGEKWRSTYSQAFGSILS